jgi:raffinose/stachyose/melibiose transport system substrate-binding protein
MQLTIWQLNGKQDALDVLVKEYNAAHPEVQIVPAYYDTDGIKDACKVAASSKTLPDMWFNWGGSLGGFFAENNLVYDLSSYARTNGWDKIFSLGALSLCTLSGKLSGYPISYNVLDVYYRKDIFAKYNLRVPTTFEEFENVCAVLKQNGITPISTGGLYGWHTMRFVELLIEHYAGAELHDKMSTFQVSHDNDATVKALTKYKEFCDKGYFPTGFITASPNDTQLAVFSGQAAMDIQGQWYDGIIIQEGQDMNLYGTFAFPSGGSNRLSAFAEMTQLNVNLSPEKLEACIKFLDFYFSKESLARFGQYFNLPLPRLDAQMPADQPNVEVMLNTSNRNGTFTITDQAFPTEIADELFRVQDGIANNQVTPKEGAARIQAAITAYRTK